MQVSKNDIACWRPDDLAEAVWDALVHRLWHATSIAGLRAILSDGCIRVVEENVGTKYRVAPLMLARGWVSLFDFGPTAGPAWLLRAQYRNWAGWLSGEYDDKAMIWLELDRDLTADKVIPAVKSGNWQGLTVARMSSQASRPDIEVPCRSPCSEALSHSIRARGSSTMQRSMPTHLPERRSWGTCIGSPSL